MSFFHFLEKIVLFNWLKNVSVMLLLCCSEARVELGYFNLYITVLRNEARSEMEAECRGCGVPSPPL